MRRRVLLILLLVVQALVVIALVVFAVHHVRHVQTPEGRREPVVLAIGHSPGYRLRPVSFDGTVVPEPGSTPVAVSGCRGPALALHWSEPIEPSFC